jgi:hypothetical protein
MMMQIQNHGWINTKALIRAFQLINDDKVKICSSCFFAGKRLLCLLINIQPSHQLIELIYGYNPNIVQSPIRL